MWMMIETITLNTIAWRAFGNLDSA